MERLTKRIGNSVDFSNEKVGEFLTDHKAGVKALFEKLAHYEDLEEQGKLIELPCNVGDVVHYECPYFTCVIGVQAYQITNVMISQNKKGEWTKKYRAMRLYNGKTIDSQINFSFDDIGKIVFLTKEEAEAKLKEMEGES